MADVNYIVGGWFKKPPSKKHICLSKSGKHLPAKNIWTKIFLLGFIGFTPPPSSGKGPGPSFAATKRPNGGNFKGVSFLVPKRGGRWVICNHIHWRRIYHKNLPLIYCLLVICHRSHHFWELEKTDLSRPRDYDFVPRTCHHSILYPSCPSLPRSKSLRIEGLGFVGWRWRVLGQVVIPCFSQDLAVHLRDCRGRVVVFCVVQVPICLLLHMIIRSCFKKFLVSPSSPHARCHRHWGNGGCQVTKTSILVFKRSSPIYEKQISTEKCIQNKTYSANWWPLRNGETWPF